MFNDIGKKIKTLASVICWLGIIVSVIAAISMFAAASESYYGGESYTILGFVYLVGGPLISWIGSFFTYGFGELIDKVSDIERNTRCCERKPDAPVQANVSVNANSERMNELEKLRSQGLITEEEYQKAILKNNN